MVWDVCAEHINIPIGLLDYSLPFQRGFERNFELIQSKKGGHRQPAVVHSDWFLEDRLFWSVSTIGYDEFRSVDAIYGMNFQIDPSVNLQALEHHLSKAEFKERNRVTQQQLQHISDIAVLDEILMSIRCYRDYNPMDLKNSAMAKMTQHKEDFLKIIVDWTISDLCPICAPILQSLCTKVRFPKGQLDALWLRQAQSSRNELDRLWTVCRATAIKQLRTVGVSKEWVEEMIDMMSAGKSSEYLEERALEEQAVHEAIDRTADTKAQKSQKIAEALIQTSWGKENVKDDTLRTVSCSIHPSTLKQSSLVHNLLQIMKSTSSGLHRYRP